MVLQQDAASIVDSMSELKSSANSFKVHTCHIVAGDAITGVFLQDSITCRGNEMVESTFLPLFLRLHEVVTQHLESIQSMTASLKAQVTKC